MIKLLTSEKIIISYWNSYMCWGSISGTLAPPGCMKFNQNSLIWSCSRPLLVISSLGELRQHFHCCSLIRNSLTSFRPTSLIKSNFYLLETNILRLGRVKLTTLMKLTRWRQFNPNRITSIEIVREEIYRLKWPTCTEVFKTTNSALPKDPKGESN